MASKAFRRLDRKVTAEYEKRGYPHPLARYIGRATAGEVASRRRRRG